MPSVLKINLFYFSVFVVVQLGAVPPPDGGWVRVPGLGERGGLVHGGRAHRRGTGAGGVPYPVRTKGHEPITGQDTFHC